MNTDTDDIVMALPDTQSVNGSPVNKKEDSRSERIAKDIVSEREEEVQLDLQAEGLTRKQWRHQCFPLFCFQATF